MEIFTGSFNHQITPIPTRYGDRTMGDFVFRRNLCRYCCKYLIILTLNSLMIKKEILRFLWNVLEHIVKGVPRVLYTLIFFLILALRKKVGKHCILIPSPQSVQ